MKNLKRRTICILFAILLFTLPITSFAHSGRTDSSGGHHDYKNKSGLGSYHYHHGMEAHLHPGGVCPYSSTDSSSQSDSYTPTSLSISIKNYPETMNVGDSAGIEYSISNATSDVSYVTSSDTNIITVNSDKTLSAVGEGTARITVKASGTTESFTVNVVAIPVEEISITNSIDKIQLGDEYKFEYTILPENATSKDITWSSDNTNVLDIDDAGRITTKSAGIATITATSNNNISSQVTLEVFEILPEKIICNNSIKLYVGNKQNFEINILPDNSNNKEFTVQCDNEDILEYSNSWLTAKSEGETTLHIETWNGIKKDIPVKVDIIPIEKIEIEDSTNYMFSNVVDKKEEISISTKIFPDNATYKDIEWHTSDDSIVNIEDDNFVINGTGKVVLEYTSHDGVSGTIDIVVIDKELLCVSCILIVLIACILIFIIIKKRNKKHVIKSL